MMCYRMVGENKDCSECQHTERHIAKHIFHNLHTCTHTTHTHTQTHTHMGGIPRNPLIGATSSERLRWFKSSLVMQYIFCSVVGVHVRSGGPDVAFQLDILS